MNEQLLEEFQAQYLATAPTLPAVLNSYRFISCLQDRPERKIWVLEHTDGRRVLCKYASGEAVTMLRNELQVDQYEQVHGRFSFFPYIIGYFETEDGAYILREYIEGETLQEKIEKNGPLTGEQALPIIQQLCRQLSLLHQAEPSLIYRDLKPSNVVLTKTGECYLIDMGAMRFFHPESGQDTVLIGTADTAAPEQYGARQTDARTDIYALGRLYSYLLTGTFDEAESKTLLTGRSAAVIKKATSFDPDRRYRSVEEFLDALTAPSPFYGKKRYLAAIAALTTALACTLVLLLAPVLSIEKREVEFSSPLMRQAVTASLGKDVSEPVTYGELQQITSLLVCGKQVFDNYDTHSSDPYAHRINGEDIETSGSIQDISLLRYMKNLNELVLDNQRITDLSPLRGLPLSHLSLCGNPFSDLSPIAGCTTLQELHISDTNVSDLSPIAGCTALEKLSISRTKITTIAPVSGTAITELIIGDIVLEDYDCLQELPIECLVCRRLPKEQFEAVSKIDTLTHIILYDSEITSLQEVTMFCNVQILDLCNNQITDILGVENFTNVSLLVLADNPLQDISGIGVLKNLTSLQLFSTAIRDFSPLEELTGLRDVSISEYQMERLNSDIPDPWFNVDIL